MEARMNVKDLQNLLQELIDKKGGRTDFDVVIQSWSQESFFGMDHVVQMTTSGYGASEIILMNKVNREVGPVG